MYISLSKTIITIDSTPLNKRNKEIDQQIEELQKEKKNIETFLNILQNISENSEKINVIKVDLESLGYRNIIKLSRTVVY